jgi:hypothetical protein
MNPKSNVSPELERWFKEALPPVISEAMNKIRNNPCDENIRRLLNDTSKKALCDLIILLERQPTASDFTFFIASFVSAVNLTLPYISNYFAAIVNFCKGGGSTIGVIESCMLEPSDRIKGIVPLIELSNAARDEDGNILFDN